jgi:4'-phosphopantetheinyl transferase
MQEKMDKVAPLSNNTLHIWQAELSADEAQLAAYHALLNADEQQRAARFYFAKHRRRYTVAHALTRCILARYLNLSPQSIVYQVQARGKPQVSDSQNSELLHFNLSHSHELMLLAIMPQVEVGVDVEYVDKSRDFLALFEHNFARSEYLAFSHLPEAARRAAFYHTWTAKEAFIKAIGMGMHFPLDKFTVRVDPQQAAALLSVDAPVLAVAGYDAEALMAKHFIQAFSPQVGYQATVCVLGDVDEVEYFSY